MVSIADKAPSRRVAVARARVVFSSASPAAALIRRDAVEKGDVLAVARVAGIMAAKRTADLIPLCHPIALSKVTVDLAVVDEGHGHGGGEQGGQKEGEGEGEGAGVGAGRVDVEATVACEGKTGVEMEALTAASTAALTVYDMCKAVDKGMRIEGLRVVLKEGGKSGRWVEGVLDESAPQSSK
ncbi:Molybdopterin cofactor biosynthesis C domain-containing protein [Xylariaceae sp. FL0804]|nr:Molybdopterin cofactor biosynthesis C domain-containing protein [Xylariaceae sp. FL0804]